MVGFRGTVEQHHAKETVKLPLRAANEDTTALIPHSALVNNVEGLKDGSRFYLAPSLPHGALQTMYIYGAYDLSKYFNVYYGRRLETMSDGAAVSADFVISKPDSKEEFAELAKQNFPEGFPKLHPRTRYLSPKEISAQASDDCIPLAVISHGLAGGSHEPIIRALTEALTSSGFEAVVLNSRGCSRTKITNPELFSGLHTDDLRDFIKTLKKEFPNRPLYGIGFSFGATILSNFLGEEGENSPFAAAAVLSNPWDMVDSAYHISNEFVSKHLFCESIAGTLSRLVKSNRAVLSQSPFFDEEKLNKKYRTTVEFDEAITAPVYGFQTAFQYYRAASSVNRLLKIQTPLLAINSFDDPVVGVTSIPTYEAKANPYVMLIKTDLGGHLAYIQSDGKSWAVNRIVEYLKAFNDTVDVTKRPVSDYAPSVSRYDHKLHY